MAPLKGPGTAPPQVLALLGKGGSAKTTSSAAIGDALSRRGYRVLLVDLDVQTSLSDWLAPRDRAKGLYSCVIEGAPIEDLAVNVRPRLDLLPSRPEDTVRLEFQIERQRDVIASWIPQAAAGYDVVVMDTPRGLGGALNLNVLQAADVIVLPAEPSGMGLDAIWAQIDLVQDIAEARRRPGLLAGILPTRVTRTNLASLTMEMLAKSGVTVLPGIPASTPAAEAVTLRKLLTDVAPDSPATVAYDDVVTALTDIELPEGERHSSKKAGGKKRKNKKGKGKK